MARKRPSAPNPNNPGQYLPLLARKAADRRRMPKEALSRSEALAEAPWSSDMPPAWESAFRAAYADQLESRGAALPAKRSGASGTTLTEEQRVERGLGSIKVRLPNAVLTKLDQDAKRVGCSRAKLLETLILGFR